MDWNLLESQLEAKLIQLASQIAKQTVQEIRSSYESNPLLPGSEPQIHLKELEERERRIQQQAEEERKKLNDEKEASKKLEDIQNTQIKLDVGGTYFSTSMTTLQKEPDSMLGSMFSGRYPIKKNDEGRVFIDRDGSVFGIILNYLRDGEFAVPQDEVVMQKLVKEIQYYGIKGMEHALNSKNEEIHDDGAKSNENDANKHIYVVGGNVYGTAKTDGVIKFDTKAWYQVVPMIVPRSHHSVASFQGKIFAVGGDSTGTSGEVLDTTKQAWKAISPMITKKKRFFLVPNSSKLYAVHKDMECYDPGRDTWISMNVTGVEDIYSAVAWNGSILASDGANIMLYDPRQHSSWRVLTTLPAEVKWKQQKIVFLQDKIYLVASLDTVFRYYDLKNNTWNKAAHLSSAKTSHEMVAHDEKIVLADGAAPTTDIYNPVINEWKHSMSRPDIRSGFGMTVL